MAPPIGKARGISLCKGVKPYTQRPRNLQRLGPPLQVVYMDIRTWSPDYSGALLECKILKGCLKLYFHWYEAVSYICFLCSYDLPDLELPSATTVAHNKSQEI
jgi:hypothetical protein